MKKEYDEKLVKGSKAAFDELITNVVPMFVKCYNQ